METFPPLRAFPFVNCWRDATHYFCAFCAFLRPSPIDLFRLSPSLDESEDLAEKNNSPTRNATIIMERGFRRVSRLMTSVPQIGREEPRLPVRIRPGFS